MAMVKIRSKSELIWEDEVKRKDSDPFEMDLETAKAYERMGLIEILDEDTPEPEPDKPEAPEPKPKKRTRKKSKEE